jgi:hypothetical protein
MRQNSSQSAQGETRLELREIIPLLLQNLLGAALQAHPQDTATHATSPPERFLPA